METKLTTKDNFRQNKPVNTQLIKYQDTKYHSHEFVEFFYVIDGEASHILDDKKSRINRGYACLLLPNDCHTFEDGDKAFLHRDILIKIDYFKNVCNQYSDTLFDEIHSKKYQLCFKIDNNLETTLEKLTENLEMSIDNPAPLLEHQIVCEIIGAILFSGTLKIKQSNDVVARLIKVLSSPDFFKYDINDIIEKENFGYCREYICRLFKQKTGLTMTSFFNTNKIEYAITLKQTGFYTASNIREIVNLTNESYFYKLLKKHSIKK